ncbi:ADP-ribosylglycohydrolase family protein [Aestuariivirga sp.]|uniref:ADP-ribosylglycohydrolase family protein n=1 Tax=Aestuariivirga sp. TaxID=2650926 RepID=UPI00391AC946
MPEMQDQALRDRARGALLGLAVGDALGTTLEFRPKDSYEPLTTIVGGGPFRLKPGEWTDDTTMALALGTSLAEKGGLDERDLMERFCHWAEKGEYSHNGRCFDIGNTVRGALDRFRRSGDPVAGSTDPQSAGNGSLMRLAPVAILHAFDPGALLDVARRQSAVTHGAEEAMAACAAYAGLVAEAIRGVRKAELFTPRPGWTPEKVGRAMRMETVGWNRKQVRGSGYVIHNLEAALWAVGNAKDFPESVLLAANLGEDADTTAAIAGQLAGALWGVSGIPDEWLDLLAWRDRITQLADRLHHRSLERTASP